MLNVIDCAIIVQLNNFRFKEKKEVSKIYVEKLKAAMANYVGTY